MALVHLLGVALTPRFRLGGTPADLAREALAGALDDAAPRPARWPPQQRGDRQHGLDLR
ncbi:MAG TPA: hypothetical protein VJL81_09545 [Solirubrobacterales bacterium]|nr:hypothetical protein [Solirubrobacterales bacterium]